MNYHSTRDKNKTVSGAQAIVKGLSEDGGLFVPDTLPRVSEGFIKELIPLGYQDRAVKILSLFLEDFSVEELHSFAESAYGENFDDEKIAPLKLLDEQTAVLELWHGPTSAFKDMALQMLPHLLTASMKKTGEKRKVCILAATSGDTGKAALEGFADVEDTAIIVFYPRDGVSDVQKLQMTTQSGNNVLVCSVDGNFDDAQTGVKKIFGNRELEQALNARGYFLSSANSINWGRLLPQIAYYFSAYCDYVATGRIALGEAVHFCVPTGNFGNILAGWYAKQMGLPIGRMICASNANNVLTDFIRTGVYDRNRDFYMTASPSMDILISSNLERLLYTLCKDAREVAGYMANLAQSGRYEVSNTIKEAIDRDFIGGFCGDSDAKAHIAKVFSNNKYLMDPHTAVGGYVLERFRAQTGDKTPAILVSTASPFKFCDHVLEAVTGLKPQMPGTKLLDLLSEETGEAIPQPLRGLGAKPVRFSGNCAKEEMTGVVSGYLQ